MPSDNIVVLTPKDFKGTTLPKYKDKIVLIKFYAPWCGHCKRAEHNYIKLAKEYKNDNHVVIAKIDCDKYEDFIQEFNQFANGPKVPGYPTILLYVKGVYKAIYEGNREVEDYVDFINQYY